MARRPVPAPADSRRLRDVRSDDIGVGASFAQPAESTTDAGPPAAADAPSAGSEAGEDLLAEATRQDDETAATLADLLERLEAERVSVADRLRTAERFEEESILEATDEALDANAETIARLQRRARRLDVAAGRVAERLELTTKAEGEQRKRAAYDAAAQQVRELERWIREDYAACAAAIGTGLARLVEVAAVIETINAELPAGAGQLDLEGFRALPATEDQVAFRPGSAVYYVDEAGHEVVPSDEQPLGQEQQSGQFWIGRTRVSARYREERVTLRGRPRAVPRALATAVRLPGVDYADTDFWPPRSKAWGSA